MKKYKVAFGNGISDDIVAFYTTASSEDDALENVTKENPEYSSWISFVTIPKKKEKEINNYGDDNYSTPEYLQL